MLKVDEAKKELEEKTYLQIQEETAWKWGSRACAMYQSVSETDDPMQMIGRLMIGNEYMHEAIEHAALYEDGGHLLAKVQGSIDPYHNAAAKHVGDELEKD